MVTRWRHRRQRGEAGTEAEVEARGAAVCTGGKKSRKSMRQKRQQEVRHRQRGKIKVQQAGMACSSMVRGGKAICR